MVVAIQVTVRIRGTFPRSMSGWPVASKLEGQALSGFQFQPAIAKPA
jgi:hypothetical protein